MESLQRMHKEATGEVSECEESEDEGAEIEQTAEEHEEEGQTAEEEQTAEQAQAVEDLVENVSVLNEQEDENECVDILFDDYYAENMQDININLWK